MSTLSKPRPARRSLHRLVMPRPIKVRAIQTMQSDGKQGWTAFERIRLGVSAYIVPADEYRRLKAIERTANVVVTVQPESRAGEAALFALESALKQPKKARRHNEAAHPRRETEGGAK